MNCTGEITEFPQGGARRFLIASLLFASALFSQAAIGTDELADFPSKAYGTWQVESVLVNLGSGRTLNYQRDDPRLIGKEFSFGPHSIRSNTAEARECTNAKVSVWIAAAEMLVQKTLASSGIPASPATDEDYELPLAPGDPVSVNSVLCGSGHFGPRPLREAKTFLGPKNTGTWIVLLPDGRLAIRWYDQTILLLRHIPL